VVLGIGLNLRRCPDLVPPLGSARATSVEEELGFVPDEMSLADDLLTRAESWYHSLRSGGEPLLQRWRALSPGQVGRRVTVVEEGTAAFSGITRGIAADGALRVEREDGRTVLVRTAELRRVVEG
jgi:biotin-(acetyl-CoA carboxylase) ligase